MKSKQIIVAPSVLACDFNRLGEECQRAERGGADWLHMDIMDGHFVDNISFGPDIVRGVTRKSKLPLDVHLMIERPDRFYPRFVPFADRVTVHIEPEYEVGETLAAIVRSGTKAGLALSPPTPLKAVEAFFDRIDLLLVMTVNPGFGGQAFMPEIMEKVREAAAIRSRRNLDFHIEVDGGIHPETSAIAREAGANVLVAGTGVFRAEDIEDAIRQLRGAE
jgi:ribulose-phosphate 3-epimerase